MENCDQNALENDNDDDKKGHKNVLFGGLYFFLLGQKSVGMKKNGDGISLISNRVF